MIMSIDSRTSEHRALHVHHPARHMPVDYQSLRFHYQRSPDFEQSPCAHYPVLVVGAGPVGLVTAIDLARQGLPVVLLDDDDRLSGGSRALCYAKRTLEVLDRLGCGDRVVEKGVSWNVGKVFFRDEPVYQFNLLPEEGHQRPAFVNLQQYYLEGYLHECASSYPNLDIRWKNKVTQLENSDAKVKVTVTTPEGGYTLNADYVIAADGARSPLRGMLNLESKGRIFQDRFLIADVKMKAPFPAERWFWFDPPFHPNQSVLLHREADDVWRIDFQLGWDADPEQEKTPERVIPRVRALLGDDVAFDLEWVSVYTFACMRMEKFRHGRVIFAGDAAHGVSPFGARGANSGVQDADNLGWKLGMVLRGEAPVSLLDTYGIEREHAADENILNSTRATDFITPKSPISRVFRDAVLSLSKHHAFAQKLVNSGRLSTPTTYLNSPLNTPDSDSFAGLMQPGAPVADAPVVIANHERHWFLHQIGDRFTTVLFTDTYRPAAEISDMTVLQVLPAGASASPHVGTIVDVDGLLAARFDARPGTTYLLRPDQHVAARWREFDPICVKAAWRRAIGQELPS
jgi:3-(3-hydroxy-phenyl)propionate hydroxylase